MKDIRLAESEIWVVCCERESLSGGKALSQILGGGAKLVEPARELGIVGGGLLRSVAALGGARLEAALLAQLVDGDSGIQAPAAIVAMDISAAWLVDHWLKKREISAPLVGVVGGLALDPDWGKAPVDRLIVLDETQGSEALALGMDDEALVPIGLPICERFAELGAADRGQIRKGLGLPVDRPICLVVCEELEEHLSAILFQLSLVDRPVLPIFDVDRDDAAANLLRERAAAYGVKAHLFGHVEEAGDLWAAADIVAARPRLGVEQRSLTLRQPLLAVCPAGPTERFRVAAHRQRRWGRCANSPAVFAVELEALLDGRSLDHSNITPGLANTKRIAAFIHQLSADRDQVMANRRGDGPALSEGAMGPLEAIGAETPRASASEDPSGTRSEARARVAEHQSEVSRWQGRLNMAKDKAQPDLVQHAEKMLDFHRRAMHGALAELAQWADVPSSRQPAGAGMDPSFEEMEIDEALAELKRKMGRDPS